VKVEPEADVGTGFVVVGAEGTVVVDGRLETRIDRLASVLAIEIHTRLQEEP
jgi:vacuolar-type H+-ATPase subunit E/Vma4